MMGGPTERRWWLWAALMGCLWAWAWAAPHPVIVELRETPVEPSPSLRSQLRGAIHRFAVLTIDSSLCPNSLAASEAAEERNATAKVVRAMFQGPPPPDDLSIIVRIDRHSVKAFVQGVPVDLSGKTDLMDASGSRRAWRPHPRSVGVLVIHPTTARILRRYVHPPHARAASLRAFVEALQPGRVVLMVGVTTDLSPGLKDYLTSLGVFLPPPPPPLPPSPHLPPPPLPPSSHLPPPSPHLSPSPHLPPPSLPSSPNLPPPSPHLSPSPPHLPLPSSLFPPRPPSSPPSPPPPRVLWAWVGRVGGPTLSQTTKMVGGERERDNGEERERKEEEKKNKRNVFMMEVYVPLLPESPWCGHDARTPAVLPATRAGSELWAARAARAGSELWAARAARAWSERWAARAWSERWAARAELCSKYDGYGSWCACSGRSDPLPPHFRPPESEMKAKEEAKEKEKKEKKKEEVEKRAKPEEVLTVVLASRPTALHRLLESLEAAKGVDLSSSVLAFASHSTEELSLVSASHGVPLEATERSSDCEGLHVALLYQSALVAALMLRPKAEVIVALEDDMLVEAGFYSWISQGIRLVDEDDRFICVNSILQEAGRGRGSRGAEGELRRAKEEGGRRGEAFQPGFAARRRVVEAMLRFWPMSKRDVDWDTLLEHWAGSEACLSPARAVATHARASDLSTGGDLPPPA